MHSDFLLVVGESPCTVTLSSAAKIERVVPKIFIYRVGAKSDKNKKNITFLIDIKRDERAKRQKNKVDVCL